MALTALEVLVATDIAALQVAESQSAGAAENPSVVVAESQSAVAGVEELAGSHCIAPAEPKRVAVVVGHSFAEAAQSSAVEVGFQCIDSAMEAARRSQ